MGSRGMGTTRPGVADFIPIVGQAFQADEGGRMMAKGHPIAGLGNVALAAIPAPALARGAKAVSEAVRGGEAVAERVAPKITAYHGSPHTFDKFDTAKIGTGEGAQAYGHGLYFAENEKTAQAYRDALKWRGTDWGDPESVASFWVQNRGGVDPAKQWLEATARSIEKNPANHPDAASNKAVTDALDLLNNGYAGQKGSANPGSMYQVGINAHPDHFLDWDKPLSEQHPRAQDAFAKLGYDTTSPDAVTQGADGRWYVMAGGKTVGNPRGFPTQGDASYAHGVIAEASAKNAKTTPGEIISNRRLSYTPEGLSDHLSQAGIPGIKYLDQGSRGAGDGTRNYVVFDPANIDILKRYGITAAALGGAGAVAAGAPSQANAAPAPRGMIGRSAP